MIINKQSYEGKSKISIFRTIKRGSYISYTRLGNKINYQTLRNNGYDINRDGILTRNGAVIKTGLDRDGYERTSITLMLKISGDLVPARITVFIHQLVAMKYVVNNNLKQSIVNHIDGNKQNNKANNLEWCSHKQNMVHNLLGEVVYKGKVKKLSCEDLLYIKTVSLKPKYLSYIMKINAKDIKRIRQSYKGNLI